ncbi:hypothetical protein [Streptomyces sp. OE57]
MASALVLLIGFPADIVNKTIEENRQEIDDITHVRQPPPQPLHGVP